ncbi:hypothetical protein MMC30_001182 [Trapelia coarctata]|nr:hypothetical protein [Trapelia coarctata]
MPSQCSRKYSSAPLRPSEIEELLATPSWSVKSLLDTHKKPESDASITQKQLHHLLRLSALPLPKSPEEEEEMIKTLESQLHFVQAIQGVDTTGVEPLRSIRDETEEAKKENAVTLESMKEELSKEEVVGHSRRIRRKKSATVEMDEASNWDPLALASKRIGRYIVVDTGKSDKGKS